MTYFYKGLIYRGLADIYGLTFNDQEKLRYRQLEYDAFVEAGATRHTDFAIKQLASSYTEIHNFEKGGEYYNQAIEIAKEKGIRPYCWKACLVMRICLR